MWIPLQRRLIAPRETRHATTHLAVLINTWQGMSRQLRISEWLRKNDAADAESVESDEDSSHSESSNIGNGVTNNQALPSISSSARPKSRPIKQLKADVGGGAVERFRSMQPTGLVFPGFTSSDVDAVSDISVDTEGVLFSVSYSNGRIGLFTTDDMWNKYYVRVEASLADSVLTRSFAEARAFAVLGIHAAYFKHFKDNMGQWRNLKDACNS